MKDLKNAIHMRNEYQRVAAPILEFVKEASKPFIGKKIDTLKGLSANYSKAVAFDTKGILVKPLDGTKWANVHRGSVQNSYGSLKVEISLCFSDGSTGCTYESRTYYFGKTENSILLSIDENCKVDLEPLDYEQELAAIKKYRELEKQMEDAKSKIKIGSDVYKYIH